MAYPATTAKLVERFLIDPRVAVAAAVFCGGLSAWSATRGGWYDAITRFERRCAFDSLKVQQKVKFSREHRIHVFEMLVEDSDNCIRGRA